METEPEPAAASTDRDTKRPHGTLWRWLRRTAFFFLVLVFAIGLFIGYQLWGPVVTSEELTGLSQQNVQGSIDAPIRIVEFGDFGCPGCQRWHRSGIKQQVKEMYGDQVSFTYRHLPVVTEHSELAAIAAQCAGEQGAFWKYHDFLYERADGLSEPQLKHYAGDLGLNAQAFETCLQSVEISDYVERDKRSAFRDGAIGTPAFFVNGELVYGPSFEELKSLIEALQ